MKPILALALLASLAACDAATHDTKAERNEAPAMNDAQLSYEAVNQRMHEGMAAIDPDADVAFMQGMLAHHKGAVEMSRVALKYGKDDEVKALATQIITAQQGEIEKMEAWLRARNATMEPAPAAKANEHAHH